MGDEEEEPVVGPPQVLVYDDAEGYIGKSVLSALKAYEPAEGAPFEISTATADSDVLAADVVICNVYGKSPEAIAAATAAIETLAGAELAKEKTFILLSSVMTWGRTPPEMEGEDEDAERVEISDTDFSKRRCLPSYKPNLTLERLVYKASKQANLKTYIVCGGLLYGQGETDQCFHGLFKSAWHCEAQTMYGAGGNFLPTIHVTDLGSVVAKIAGEPPEHRYCLAVTGNNTLAEITGAVEKALGGSVVSMAEDEVAMLTSDDAEFLTIDQKLTSTVVADLGLELVCPDGFIGEEEGGGMDTAIAQYRTCRGLTPVAIFVHGPPSVGSTEVAAELAKQFKLNYYTKANILAAAMETAVGEKTAYSKVAKQIKKAQDKKGKVPLSLCLQWVRMTLNKPGCVNRGYVLDSFPENHKQANNIFKKMFPVDEEGNPPEEEEIEDDLDTYGIPEPVEGEEPEEAAAAEEEEEEEPEEEEEEEEGALVAPEGKVPTPEFVLVLNATDEELAEKVKTMAEADIVAEYGEDGEEGFLAKLAAWRAVDAAKPTAVDFFENQDIDPVTPSPLAGDDAVGAMAARIGAPHNYGLTPTQVEEAAAVAAAAAVQAEAEAAAVAAKADAEAAAVQAKKEEELSVLQGELEREEDEILKLRSRPLRKYLMDHVIPTLTQGLIQTCKLRPVDPIDHLAEFLFTAVEQQVAEVAEAAAEDLA